MWYVVGAAVIGAGASIYSANKSAQASEEAGRTQAFAADEASQLQWNMYKQSRADQMPWLEAGRRGLSGLEREMEAGPGEFKPEEQPGYKFGFEEFVQKPYMSSQGAKGKRLSGESMKGLTRYAQDYASTSYDNFLQRYYQRLNPYQTLAGVGQTASARTGQQSMQQGQLQGDIAMGKANALGEAQINAQNARTQGLQNVSDLIGNYAAWRVDR